MIIFLVSSHQSVRIFGDSLFGRGPDYYEARNDFTNNSETILLCNTCLNACKWHVHRKYLIEAPELHKIMLARKPSVTNVLCNWEISSQKIKVCVCVIILCPIAMRVKSPPITL